VEAVMFLINVTKLFERIVEEIFERLSNVYRKVQNEFLRLYCGCM